MLALFIVLLRIFRVLSSFSRKLMSSWFPYDIVSGISALLASLLMLVLLLAFLLLRAVMLISLLLLVAGITAVACVTSAAFVHAVAMAILLLLAWLHVAPLFLILREFLMRTKHIIGDFEGFFRGAKTFLKAF